MNLGQDIRYGLRMLARKPGFTAIAVLTLALGIGANTATFSVANTLLLTTSPLIEDPTSLARMHIRWASGLEFGSFSYPDFIDMQERNEVLTGLIASSIRPLHLSDGSSNDRISGAIVSGNYFEVLGVAPALGRGFLPEEYETSGTHPFTVLSHGLWGRRFGGDPGVVGQTVSLNNYTFTIVGVAPRGFNGVNAAMAPDLWVTLKMQDELLPGPSLIEARGSHWLNFVIGRLKPGVTLAQAETALNGTMARLIEEFPDTNEGKSVALYPESGLPPFIRPAFVGFMGLMFAVVGFILLLACANVAGLLLARLSARRKEIGIRLSLGASRPRLIRQLLAESIPLCLMAGAAGLALALGLIRMVQSLVPQTGLPISTDVRLDWPVLAFTLVASALTGLLFGLMPALQATRRDLVSSLKETGFSLGGKNSRLREVLVVGQVAISVVLLVLAGLAIGSLGNARNLDPGFDPDNMLTASVELGLQGYDERGGRVFRRSLLERIERIPGVTAVGIADTIPLTFSTSDRGVVPEGFEVAEGSDSPNVLHTSVDAGYFQAMGIPLLQGRGFDQRDGEDGRATLVINEAFAERFWPGENPIGKRVRTWRDDHVVIGLVKTGKYRTLGEDPTPYMYFSAYQHYSSNTVLMVRTKSDALSAAGPLREEIRQLDRTLPVSSIKTMHAAMGFALFPAVMAANVVSGFAVLALVLAAVGLYGVISYSVSQGLRDIAIRMAIGARPADVLGRVIRGGMTLTLAGLGIGLSGGAALAVFAGSLMYGVGATQVGPYLTAAAALGAVALLASYLPARRAARVDPMAVLRGE